MSTDLRYPIGRFSAPVGFDATQRASGIRTLAEAPARFRLAVAGLSEAQLDTPYRTDGWTVRQLVHHVADSHMHAYIRTKFALSVASPTIMPYPEAVWAELTDGRTAAVATSLDLLDALHHRWVMLLRSLSDDQWMSSFIHPERGPMTLNDLLPLYDWHSRHHIAHITELRTRQGW